MLRRSERPSRSRAPQWHQWVQTFCQLAAMTVQLPPQATINRFFDNVPNVLTHHANVVFEPIAAHELQQRLKVVDFAHRNAAIHAVGVASEFAFTERFSQDIEFTYLNLGSDKIPGVVADGGTQPCLSLHKRTGYPPVRDCRTVQAIALSTRSPSERGSTPTSGIRKIAVSVMPTTPPSMSAAYRIPSSSCSTTN
jgi:hypothetical protein